MLRGHERKRRVRDPERTRERLLQAAFREVCRSGFQSAGIDKILDDTNVTKGALYYHFDSKEALGYAIVDEIMAKLVRNRWLCSRLSVGQTIDILIGMVGGYRLGPKTVESVVRCSIGHRRCLRWTSNSASDWRGYSLAGRKELQRFCGKGSPKEPFAAT